MPAITHQRADNVREITRLALALYDGKSEDRKRNLFENYVIRIAHDSTVKEQREWITILKAAVKDGEK
jgi:hypothetical protein